MPNLSSPQPKKKEDSVWFAVGKRYFGQSFPAGETFLRLLVWRSFRILGALVGAGFLFLHKAISYAVGFVSRKRPFSTEAHIGLSYAVEKGLFRLNFFRLKIPTGGSSRKARLFRLDPPVEKLGRKSFTPVFLNRPHRSSHHQTHPHGHTPIPSTTLQHHTRR